MKTIIFGALALAFAVPAAAQTAPATDPHAGHAQHQQGEKKDGMDCKERCEKMMKQHEGMMDHGAKSDAPASEHQDHAH